MTSVSGVHFADSIFHMSIFMETSALHLHLKDIDKVTNYFIFQIYVVCIYIIWVFQLYS